MNKILFALATLLLALPVAAQNKAGLWSEVSIEKAFSKRFSTEISFGQRQDDNFRQASRWNAGFDVEYKVSKAFRLGAGYVYLYDYNAEEATPRMSGTGVVNGYNVDADFWRSKHRFFFDLNLRHRFNKRWGISFRERFQYTRNMGATTTEWKYRKPILEGDNYTGERFAYNGVEFKERSSEPDQKSAKNKYYVRHRVGVDYNIKGLPLEPYATYEMANDAGNDLAVVRHRVVVGTKWKLSLQHSLDLGYLFQRGEMDDGERGNLHVVSVGYQFKF